MPYFLGIFMHVWFCACHWYKLAVKMTLSASDSFKRWKLWVNVWCITVCVSVCMQKPFLLGEKTAFQLLSGSYQNGTDHLPLLSYQCRVNCLSEEKQNRGGWVCVPCSAVPCAQFLFCLFVAFFSLLFLLTSVTVESGCRALCLESKACNPSFGLFT